MSLYTRCPYTGEWLYRGRSLYGDEGEYQGPLDIGDLADEAYEMMLDDLGQSDVNDEAVEHNELDNAA